MVLHSFACVCLWYASNVATVTVEHFASVCVIKIEIGKIDVKCFMLACLVCGICLVGLNYSGSRGQGLDPVKLV